MKQEIEGNSLDLVLQKIEEEEKNSIAIDFDGVIHKNSKGFYDGTIYDVLIDGAYEALEQISKTYRIVIYTCKANPNRPLVNGMTGVELIEEWLKKHDMSKFVDKIVWGKPNAKFYIDDKGYHFTTWEKYWKDNE
tara:strand:- start:4338 stop:4742 length:405 start_codon:yes stop_codon:yes gene_type:complete